MNLTFTALFVANALCLLVVEIIGVRRKGKGDTITENWRWVDGWLAKDLPVGRWLWRVFTLGLLAWTALHLPNTHL